MPGQLVSSPSRILCDMIALRTVNPMGRPRLSSLPVERPVIEYIERVLRPYGLATRRQACGPHHENFIAVVPGQSDACVTLFESHIDTVPEHDWGDDAFTPRLKEGIIHGRGACDDKGSLASMLVALLNVLESSRKPPNTIVFVAAGDEEYAQLGIKAFMKDHGLPITRCVFGEPTLCRPIVQHKGTIRWDICVHGRSAHSACPELGENAIGSAMMVLQALAAHEQTLHREHQSDLLSPPSVTVTMIRGGQTRNVIPDRCTLAGDLRVCPGTAVEAARQLIIDAIGTLGIETTHGEPQLKTPPLNTLPTDPFAVAVARFCGDTLGEAIEPGGVPYGTDASWAPDEAATLVLGPGNIDTAHTANECVTIDQLEAAVDIYQSIMTMPVG